MSEVTDEQVYDFAERIIRFINRRSYLLDNRYYVIPMCSVADEDLMREFSEGVAELIATPRESQ